MRELSAETYAWWVEQLAVMTPKRRRVVAALLREHYQDRVPA